MKSETIETTHRISGKLETSGTTGGDYSLSWELGSSSVEIVVNLWTCPVILGGFVEIQDDTLVKILESKGYTVTKL